jgi:hypothetical protein
LGLPGYNDFILKVIRKQVDAGINNVLAQQAEEQMKSLLSPPPTEIKLTDLVKQFIEANQSSDCSCDGSDGISLHIRASERGWHWIALDEDEGKSEYNCDNRFGVSPDGGIFAFTFKEKDPAKTLFIGSIYGFARSLFQMHVAGTKLIVDCSDADEIETNYPGRGEY